MSKTALGFRLSASGMVPAGQMPFPEVANSFTVMPPLTSVMSHSLAGSVLIRVGKVSPAGLLQGEIGSVLRLDSRLCAVTGGTCIK